MTEQKLTFLRFGVRKGLLQAMFMVCLLVPLSAAANIPDGSYEGTLSCGAGQGTDIGPPFTAATKITVDGNKLTWTRQTASMKEVVSGTLIDGKTSLEGYGGSVSAATRQAFWDWRLKAQLAITARSVSGEAQILSKDGGTVQRSCKFFASVPGGAIVAEAPSAPARVDPSIVRAEPPQAPQPQAVAKAAERAAALTADAVSKELGLRDASLKQKEIELARREREAALRERELALRAKEKALAQQAAQTTKNTVEVEAHPMASTAVTVPTPAPVVKPLTEPGRAPLIEAAARVEPTPAAPVTPTTVVATPQSPVVDKPSAPVVVASAQAIEAPVAKSASFAPVPPSSSKSKSEPGMWDKVLGGALLLVLSSLGWNVYPKFFQARADNYYKSPWQRFKGRLAFTGAFCIAGVFAMVTVIPLIREALKF